MNPVEGALRWTAALANEVARLPATIGRARNVLYVLPEQLEGLVGALDSFTTLLDASLTEVRDEVHDVGGRIERLQASMDTLAEQLSKTTVGIDTSLPTLTDAVLRLDGRLVAMQELLDELGGTVVGTISAVPGLRRAGRRTRPGSSAGGGEAGQSTESPGGAVGGSPGTTSRSS